MKYSQPKTSEEYIARVKAQAEAQKDEHVPSHAEIINQYRKEKHYYEEKLSIVLGVIFVLIVVFFVVKGVEWQGKEEI